MTTSKDLNPALAEDLLEGAEAIATFGGWKTRQVYYMAGKKELKSIFTLNGKLNARKSSLIREIEALESSAGGERNFKVLRRLKAP